MFQLKKVATVDHNVRLRQVNEDGSVNEGSLKVRYNVKSRADLDQLANGDEDDDRLMFDVVVNKIVDPVQNDEGRTLTDDEARQAIRNDLSLSAQIVAQYWELMNGVLAKNAKRSRGA